MRKKIILGILSFFSFAIGVNIYSDLRGYDWGLFKWVDILLPLNLNSISHLLGDQSFILYNLPDGLWMVSFMLLLTLLWSGKSRLHLLWWLIVTLLIGLSMEVMQYYNWLSGTFDLWDMLTYIVIFFFFSIILFIKKSILWKI
jgi:hypothetical protein